MRQRTTFIQPKGAALDPATLQVQDTSINGPDIDALREDRVTLALDELPAELQNILGACHELHIRWVSPYTYETLSPLYSRLSPGLHVFYTPRQGTDSSSSALCSLLQKLFGELDCSSPEASFTSLPHDRFSHSAALQYYQQLENLAVLVKYLRDELCPATDPLCVSSVERLVKVASLDLSYDTISHALKVTGVWPHQHQPLQIASHPGYRTEIGILAPDSPPNLEAYELGVSGVLTVLGQDRQPSPTLFAFPSRHRHVETKFSSGFLEPVGLHPSLQLSLRSAKPPDADSYCSLHAYLTLPRTVFGDKYQLADPLFLSSKNLSSLRYITQPVDLEAPDYVLGPWGSALLLELSPPAEDAPWTAEIPLHLRYLAPKKGGYSSVEMPYPVVFWACTAEEGTKFSNNPFDRVNLGYDGLFGPRTVFWHIDPQPEVGQRLINEIRVPVLDLNKSSWVNAGTAVAVVLGFAWIVWKLVGVFLTGLEKSPARIKSKKLE